ncbi:MAG TPA: GDYXXLXY domain-containing protein [Pontiella sp.]|nr:GDYXXLXY domain-containing protein [Pontiella sp.]
MKKPACIIMGILIIAQFAVPVSMIRNRETILNEGGLFRFKTQPIDPADPFQGRYVRLGFEQNYIRCPEEMKWEVHYRQPIYALLGTDQDGFACFTGWSSTRPAQGAYLKSRFLWEKYSRPNDDSKRQFEGLMIEMPLDRFYMDEAKAPRAERLVRDATRTTNCWANIRILDGKAVIEDVMVEGRSIRELAAEKE